MLPYDVAPAATTGDMSLSPNEDYSKMDRALPRVNGKEIAYAATDKKDDYDITITDIAEHDDEDGENTTDAASLSAFDQSYRKIILASALLSVPLLFYLVASDPRSQDWYRANALLALKAGLLALFHAVCGGYRLGRGRGHVRAKGSVPWPVDVMSALAHAAFFLLHAYFAWEAHLRLDAQRTTIISPR